MPSDSQQPLYPLRVAVRRTGLKADVIRAWERRYGAIQPERSAANQRLFSEANILRLGLLRDAVRSGMSIGQVAELDDEALARLIGAPETAELGSDQPLNPAEPALQRSLEAIREFDSDALRRELEAQIVALGRFAFLENFVFPLMARVGELYQAGSLRIAHEHLASTTLRSVLETLRPAYPPDSGAPGVVVATPKGQHHELAAMTVAATASLEGWRVTYLGTNLPAEELAAAARSTNARLTVLSLSLSGDAALAEELRRLRAALPGELLVGGHAVRHYRARLEKIGVEVVESLSGLRRRLAELRARPERVPSRPPAAQLAAPPNDR